MSSKVLNVLSVKGLHYHVTWRVSKFYFNFKIYCIFNKRRCNRLQFGTHSRLLHHVHYRKQRFLFYPLYFHRYVDDIFAILPSEQAANDFFSIINTIHANVQFTVETENNFQKFKFLDVTVRIGIPQLEAEWSLKDHGCVYINNCAIAPSNYKRAAIRSLIYPTHILAVQHLYKESFSVIRQRRISRQTLSLTVREEQYNFIA